VLAALFLVTVGLATGSHWAYAELGWGGYWGWDPVENTALIVWLLLLVAVHQLRTAPERARSRQRRLLALAMPLPAALAGSAVTRSGRLSSVHAFADADALAWTLGAIAIFATATGIGVVRRMAPSEESRDLPPRSQLALAGVASTLGVIAAAIIALAVTAPLLVDVASGRVIDIEPWFYSRTLAPVAVLAVVGSFIAIARRPTRRSVVMVVAHFGFAVMLVGVFATTTVERTARAVAPGESFEVADLTIEYEQQRVVDGPRRQSEAVVLDLVVRRAADPSNVIDKLQPSLGSLPLDAVTLPEVATASSWTRDVQVFVRSVNRDGIASIDAAVRPGTRLVWLGAALMALASAIGAWGARRSSAATPGRTPDSHADSISVAAG